MGQVFAVLGYWEGVGLRVQLARGKNSVEFCEGGAEVQGFGSGLVKVGALKRLIVFFVGAVRKKAQVISTEPRGGTLAIRIRVYRPANQGEVLKEKGQEGIKEKKRGSLLRYALDRGKGLGGGLWKKQNAVCRTEGTAKNQNTTKTQKTKSHIGRR